MPAIIAGGIAVGAARSAIRAHRKSKNGGMPTDGDIIVDAAVYVATTAVYVAPVPVAAFVAAGAVGDMAVTAITSRRK